MPFKFDDFHACLNQTFLLDAGKHGEVALQLISVDRHPESVSTDGRDVFSVLFRGPADTVFDQQIYPLSNETMGEMDLFIVPVGPDKQGMCYEAVFS